VRGTCSEGLTAWICDARTIGPLCWTARCICCYVGDGLFSLHTPSPPRCLDILVRRFGDSRYGGLLRICSTSWQRAKDSRRRVVSHNHRTQLMSRSLTSTMAAKTSTGTCSIVCIKSSCETDCALQSVQNADLAAPFSRLLGPRLHTLALMYQHMHSRCCT
jgi:hypothetical protein